MTAVLEQQTPVPPSLWRAPGLGALFTASTTARLANEAARVAMVLLVLDRTGSPALAGTVVGALALPALVTGPVLGAWLDRTEHRRWVFVANQVLLLGVLLALLAVTGAAPSYVVVLAEEVGQPAAAGGALFSAFALGALVGSLAVASRAPRTGPMRMAFAGILGLALAFTAVAAAPNLAVALGVVALAGAMEGPVLASTLSVRSAHTPAHMQTQVVTTAASLKFGGFALGSAVTGQVVAAHGVRIGLLGLAVMQLAALSLGLLARLPRR